MNASLVVAVVIALATLFGVARTWRTRPANTVLRCALQIATAIALYFCLFPPSTSERFARGELVVLTPGATPAQIDAAHGDVIALPGVDAPRAVERMPDLATALRRHVDARSLRIVGGGLPARDRDAARGLVAAFDAAPLPRGVVELDAPAIVAAGSLWRMQGRVEGAADGRVTRPCVVRRACSARAVRPGSSFPSGLSLRCTRAAMPRPCRPRERACTRRRSPVRGSRAGRSSH